MCFVKRQSARGSLTDSAVRLLCLDVFVAPGQPQRAEMWLLDECIITVEQKGRYAGAVRALF